MLMALSLVFFHSKSMSLSVLEVKRIQRASTTYQSSTSALELQKVGILDTSSTHYLSYSIVKSVPRLLVTDQRNASGSIVRQLKH